MVSKQARKLLIWMMHHDGKSYYLKQLREAVDDKIDFTFLQELCSQKYIAYFEPFDFLPPTDDFSDPEYTYRITDFGKATMESRREYIFIETRAWVTATIAVVAFIKSFFF